MSSKRLVRLVLSVLIGGSLRQVEREHANNQQRFGGKSGSACIQAHSFHQGQDVLETS